LAATAPIAARSGERSGLAASSFEDSPSRARRTDDRSGLLAPSDAAATAAARKPLAALRLASAAASVTALPSRSAIDACSCRRDSLTDVRSDAAAIAHTSDAELRLSAAPTSEISLSTGDRSTSHLMFLKDSSRAPESDLVANCADALYKSSTYHRMAPTSAPVASRAATSRSSLTPSAMGVKSARLASTARRTSRSSRRKSASTSTLQESSRLFRHFSVSLDMPWIAVVMAPELYRVPCSTTTLRNSWTSLSTLLLCPSCLLRTSCTSLCKARRPSWVLAALVCSASMVSFMPQRVESPSTDARRSINARMMLASPPTWG